ncbi:Pogo transposable element with KRAB domain protein [Blattella germanica]|nr:Pogo transposable element with KRAB domain protein [Blattella germanica]
MTEDLFMDWLKSMLVLDSFRGHLTENVKLKLRQENCDMVVIPGCDMVVIPGGMTGMLQPLDVSFNRPFKTHLQRSYREWRCSSTEMTPTGRLKKPSLPQMCEWIVSAGNSISEEMVAKSFKVTSISIAMDGSEDGAVWCASDREESTKSVSDMDESDNEL